MRLAAVSEVHTHAVEVTGRQGIARNWWMVRIERLAVTVRHVLRVRDNEWWVRDALAVTGS